MSAESPSPAILRDVLRRRLEAEFERRIAAGIYPYDGRWLARDAVERTVAARERASRARLVELALLLGAGWLAGLVLLALTVALGR